jgi:hypothetical protein
MSKFWSLPFALLLPVAAQACDVPGWTPEALRELKAAAFEVEDGGRRDALALGLTHCVGDPDPAVRDGIVYEGLAHWLRAGLLEEEVLRELHVRLLASLRVRDAAGFEAPFAALVLSEVARSDRIKPWLTADGRGALAAAAASYLSGVDDYRGFDDREGWRHGVAHGADFALQLVLNERVGRGDVDRLVAAVLAQVSPRGHFYRFGEPARLARPLLHAAARGLHEQAERDAWIERVASPAPLADWNQAFASESGLAHRHNTMAFLLAAHAMVALSSDEGLRPLQPAIEAALKRIP